MKILLRNILTNVKETADPRNLPYCVFEIFRFMGDYFKYRKRYHAFYPLRLSPIFYERTNKSRFDPHYAYQAYWATKRIVSEKLPRVHLDISSSVTFVTQLCGILPVVHLEYRPPSVMLSSYRGIRGDIGHLPFKSGGVESLSCLHVIEHVGLGRYGDCLDVDACWNAMHELERVVTSGGRLLMSVPVGKPAVYFNANIVFAAEDIVMAMKGLQLREFSLIRDDGTYVENASLAQAADMSYALGMFDFRRV